MENSTSRKVQSEAERVRREIVCTILRNFGYSALIIESL